VTVATICWGHDTNVEEDNILDFTGNWTGTGTIAASGDAERIILYPGQYMESEVRFTGGGWYRIIRDKYGLLGSGSPLLQYKTGTSEVDCNNDTWHNYTGPFVSEGYIKVRVSYS
jgi:hypothetical protein